MNHVLHPVGLTAAIAVAAIFSVGPSTKLAGAQQGSVAHTVHNLSISGPGDIKATSETEICKFCHIPHNTVEKVPLWGHALSDVSRYDTPDVSRGGARRPAPQPDGASRLCLSCHDGTVALGDVAGEPSTIAIAGGQRLRSGRPGFIGTDLSGSHPISFFVTDDQSGGGDQDMGLRSLAAMTLDRDVRLDEFGKMQCTTCHDPHRDDYYIAGKVPHFWVKPSFDEVCLTCHALR